MQVKRITSAVAAIAFLVPSGPVRAANQVVIDSKLGPACAPSISVSISIENDVDLQSVSIPLVVRSITGGAFWRGPVDTLPASGRLATSLTGGRWLETGGVDFIGNDQVALMYEASGMPDCLPAGPLEIMTGLSFGLIPNSGLFEIDTMVYAPCYRFEMLACSDGLPVTVDAFTKGLIEVLAGGHPSPLSFTDDTLSAWAGATLLNQALAIDPEGDPLGYRIAGGPGSVDENTGQWIWKSSPADSGTIEVLVTVFEENCGFDVWTKSFLVELRQLVPGDLNCDGVVNVFDVVAEVDMAFREGDPVIPCYDQ